MSIFCAFIGHEPGPDEVWNRGYYFSRCARCGTDLIRSDGEWSAVPRGHRVVWKPGRHQHSLEPDYSRNLPVLYRAPVQPPAVLPLGAWHRRLLLLAGAAGGEACAIAEPAPEEEDRSGQYPLLLAVAAIAAAGLHVLISLSERR